MKTRFLPLSLLFVLALSFSACEFSVGNTGDDDDDDSYEMTEGHVEGRVVDYSIDYDPDQWTMTRSETNADAEYEFEYKQGDLYAMVIPEDVELSEEELKDAALTNAQSVAPDAEIIYTEHKTVHGVDILVMKIEGTISGIPFQYYGYYYLGSAGTIQFIAYTTQDLIKGYDNEIAELLGGLTVHE